MPPAFELRAQYSRKSSLGKAFSEKSSVKKTTYSSAHSKARQFSVLPDRSLKRIFNRQVTEPLEPLNFKILILNNTYVSLYIPTYPCGNTIYPPEPPLKGTMPGKNSSRGTRITPYPLGTLGGTPNRDP